MDTAWTCQFPGCLESGISNHELRDHTVKGSRKFVPTVRRCECLHQQVGATSSELSIPVPCERILSLRPKFQNGQQIHFSVDDSRTTVSCVSYGFCKAKCAVVGLQGGLFAVVGNVGVSTNNAIGSKAHQKQSIRQETVYKPVSFHCRPAKPVFSAEFAAGFSNQAGEQS